MARFSRYLGRVLAVVIAVALALTAAPAWADTDPPDSTPTLESMVIYRHVLETDDMLVVFKANIPYATLPSTPVTQTFLWELLDGATVLGVTTGYRYNDLGYGMNVYSMYWDADDAPAWGSAYTLRLSGNPANFVTPPSYNYAVTAAYYSSATDPDVVEAALVATVISLATELNTDWDLASTTLLTEEGDAATVLDLFGTAFFRGAIKGIQGMAPAAFSTTLRNIEVTDRTWTDTYSTDLESQYTGTWIETAQEAGGDLFGVDFNLAGLAAMFIAMLAAVLVNAWLSGNIIGGLVDASFVAVVGARLGVYGLGYLGLACALGVIYISIKLWGVLR